MDEKVSNFLINLMVVSSINIGFVIAKKNATVKLDDQGNPVIDWAAAETAVKEEMTKTLESKKESPMALVPGGSN